MSSDKRNSVHLERASLASTRVAISQGDRPWTYPESRPFLPGETYPELGGVVQVGEERNITYELTRQILLRLGMDTDRFSTQSWNPLGELVRPGQKVLVKPNLVHHLHLGNGNYESVVTHGSLVRCVLDYIALALKGKGEITLGDAPIQSANFPAILETLSLQETCKDVAQRWQIPVRLVDFRLWAVSVNEDGRIIQGSDLEGDPKGYCLVNLGERSLLTPFRGQCDLFRVTNYDCREMMKHHNETTHEYLIPRTVLDADVVINLPKLKTHRKAGLSAALKNLVGINGHKDFLPHHRSGSKLQGGDEYSKPSFIKKISTSLVEKIDRNPSSKSVPVNRLVARIALALARRVAPDPFFEGNWYGNDTIWRTVLDLNRLLVFADRNGEMADVPQRQCLTIVDAIVAGEGEGPLEPDARPCGFLAGGINPVALDAVLATMIGFDYHKIPLIARGFDVKDWPLVHFGPEKIEISSEARKWASLRVGAPCTEFSFTPPGGWVDYIEFSDHQAEVCRLNV